MVPYHSWLAAEPAFEPSRLAPGSAHPRGTLLPCTFSFFPAGGSPGRRDIYHWDWIYRGFFLIETYATKV